MGISCLNILESPLRNIGFYFWQSGLAANFYNNIFICRDTIFQKLIKCFIVLYTN